MKKSLQIFVGSFLYLFLKYPFKFGYAPLSYCLSFLSFYCL
ncbi:hypothetical protein HMPREF3189_01100 [Clostridiales bacterium KA00134]|nr:hypothetical protein HMPREF3189_01100 [Clostridiales bacterium KA00134]